MKVPVSTLRVGGGDDVDGRPLPPSGMVLVLVLIFVLEYRDWMGLGKLENGFDGWFFYIYNFYNFVFCKRNINLLCYLFKIS